MVTIAINLFCTPCLNLYSQLQDLINRYPNTFCLNIRFMGMDEEIRDQQIGLSLITMYYQDKSLFLKAFGFWKEHKDYPLFQKEFGDIRFQILLNKNKQSILFGGSKYISIRHLRSLSEIGNCRRFTLMRIWFIFGIRSDRRSLSPIRLTNYWMQSFRRVSSKLIDCQNDILCVYWMNCTGIGER